jgi:hypothetical protein
MMQLSPKAIRFIIEALEHYQTYHEERLRDENLTEEGPAEPVNDRQYLIGNQNGAAKVSQ